MYYSLLLWFVLYNLCSLILYYDLAFLNVCLLFFFLVNFFCMFLFLVLLCFYLFMFAGLLCGDGFMDVLFIRFLLCFLECFSLLCRCFALFLRLFCNLLSSHFLLVLFFDFLYFLFVICLFFIVFFCVGCFLFFVVFGFYVFLLMLDVFSSILQIFILLNMLHLCVVDWCLFLFVC
eukprot:TRINITY_DN15907_c0_g2_i2.p1 TRINITY_DN15907_c0_g2~~TRINITY_DN15907_c0_g2_i2.p1  ORF type:complete len:176 (-),score=2.14 TRINITY_DN15907_c0_g2_i2:228-755(-)